MATRYATHKAAPVRQIEKIVVGGTWVANDTVLATIGARDLTITIGADVATTQVATAIRDAWNATSRLDGDTATTDATSNFGGYECGEYMDGEAYIDSDATSTVYIKGTKPGVPFTVTFTETSAAGTLTQTTPQAATGPWHWDNSDNWDTAPVDGDTFVLQGLTGDNVGFKFGFPASLEATCLHYMSYSGQIGLPAINTWNSKPYPEYRTQYLALDFNAGSNIAHRFGLGKDGPGSPLINIVHTGVECLVVVYNTGTPQIQGRKALNIVCSDTDSTMTILGGSVDISSQWGTTCAWKTLTQSGGDVRCSSGMKAASTVVMNGGNLLLGGTTAITQLTHANGTLRLEGQTGTITALYVLDGTVLNASTAQIDSLLLFGGTWDCRDNAGTYVLTNGSVSKGARFIDPYRRTDMTNALKLTYDPSPDLQFGAQAVNTISIDNG